MIHVVFLYFFTLLFSLSLSLSMSLSLVLFVFEDHSSAVSSSFHHYSFVEMPSFEPSPSAAVSITIFSAHFRFRSNFFFFFFILKPYYNIIDCCKLANTCYFYLLWIFLHSTLMWKLRECNSRCWKYRLLLCTDSFDSIRHSCMRFLLISVPNPAKMLVYCLKQLNWIRYLQKWL